MSDSGPGGNKTVFRPSPLQALKNGGEANALTPRPAPIVAPPPPPPVVEKVAAEPRPTTGSARAGRGRTILTMAVWVVALLALGYVVLVLTGTAPGGSRAAKVGRIDHRPATLASPEAVA